MKTKPLWLSATALLLSFNANSQELPMPEVGYSAVRTIQAGGRSFETTVYYEDSKERSEMNVAGQSMVSILRHDLDVIWMLMPGGMYMEQPFDASGQTMGPERPPTATLSEQSNIAEFVEEGQEVVNGFDTTRYRVRAENADGTAVAGQIWMTDERIPVQTRFAVESGAQTGEVQMSLRDLEIGDQPDELFEIPAGYQQLDLSNMPGFGFPGASAQPDGQDPSFGDELTDAAQEGAEEAAVEETRRGVRDAVSRGLRGIFDRD